MPFPGKRGRDPEEDKVMNREKPSVKARMSPPSYEEVSELTSDVPLAVLSRPLGPEYVQRRPGPGGVSLSYLSSADAITLANMMFGHDAWSSEVMEASCDMRTEGSPAKWIAEAVCRLRVKVMWETKKATSFHDGTGFGGGEKRNTRAEAMEKAIKEAETDALKRALRKFGEALGNCLYSKPYLNWIEKVRAREGKQDATKQYTTDSLFRKPSSIPSSSQRRLGYSSEESTRRPGGGGKMMRLLPKDEAFDDEDVFEDVSFEGS
ncbi:hypothetical protein HIM_11598 [Hirsutella minnesotensis 3608]|uniref:RAD52 homolog n=1 Tax=Hirsutella minnesotensis 3608 TaxID=1043627 RepID=A0A0F8A0Z5_9HYPO|nr:hypothetical protein HIM_11598 [Hirsutella minnesotensis 3608]